MYCGIGCIRIAIGFFKLEGKVEMVNYVIKMCFQLRSDHMIVLRARSWISKEVLFVWYLPHSLLEFYVYD